MELGKKCFLRVGPERGEADPAQTILLAANHETMEVKVAPIECDLEQLVQRDDAAVTAHVQTPPNRWVNLEEQNVELVNFGGSVSLDHSSSAFACRGRCQPGFSRSPCSPYTGFIKLLPPVTWPGATRHRPRVRHSRRRSLP